MGCSTTKETVSAEMLKLVLRKNEIRRQRVEAIQELQFLVGKKVERPFIPDHIDHKFMREKKLKKEGAPVQEPTKKNTKILRNSVTSFNQKKIEEEADNNIEVLKRLQLGNRCVNRRGSVI